MANPAKLVRVGTNGKGTNEKFRHVSDTALGPPGIVNRAVGAENAHHAAFMRFYCKANCIYKCVYIFCIIMFVCFLMVLYGTISV